MVDVSMADWKSGLRRIAAQVERGIDEQRRGRPTSDEPVEIHPFRGYGTSEHLHVTARILRRPRVVPAADSGSAWGNVIESFRRLASAEVAGARIEASCGGKTVEASSDEEGYLHLVLDVADAGLPDNLIQEVTLRAIEPPSRGGVVAEVVVPPATASYGVISDIDDTIVETHATSLLRMAKTVFAQNAHGRTPMEGVAELYRQFHAGRSGSDRNPFFYVSSSPWNFYDLLDQFLAIHAIPPGPLMLQDYGLDDAKLIHSAHDDHKLRQIAEILTTYPRLPFVLIGDSGQRDPEIYRQVALAYPGRVLAVYIRDVTTAERDLAVRLIAEEISNLGIAVALAESSAAMRDHAAAAGLL
jgi:phosphatidate phosphatase APP1